MTFFSRSTLVALAAAAGFLAAAYSGCALSKLNASQANASGDSPTAFLGASPDSTPLGMALGSLGAIATLLMGGTVLIQQHRSQAAIANAVALRTEADLSPASETEIVLVSEPAEIETEVALAYRR